MMRVFCKLDVPLLPYIRLSSIAAPPAEPRELFLRSELCYWKYAEALWRYMGYWEVPPPLIFISPFTIAALLYDPPIPLL